MARDPAQLDARCDRRGGDRGGDRRGRVPGAALAAAALASSARAAALSAAATLAAALALAATLAANRPEQWGGAVSGAERRQLDSSRGARGGGHGAGARLLHGLSIRVDRSQVARSARRSARGGGAHPNDLGAPGGSLRTIWDAAHPNARGALSRALKATPGERFHAGERFPGRSRRRSGERFHHALGSGSGRRRVHPDAGDHLPPRETRREVHPPPWPPLLSTA